jgi:acyl-coenzyme A thioesterase PaaI-like protein
VLERLDYHPDPDNPGWLVRPQSSQDRFLDVYGEMRARVESPTLTRLRLTPRALHLNINDTVHGGFLLAVIDHGLFVGPAMQGRERIEGGSTIDVSTQFLAPVLSGKPIDLLIETLRETYRMAFVRGTVEQDGVAAVAFSGIVRKAGASS